MSRRPSVTFVIMAGGKGERLWPLARAATPKVCLTANGRNVTLLQATIERLRGAWPGASWLIVTTALQAKAVRASLPQGLRRFVLVEPQIKNTAACLTLAAVAAAMRDPSAVLVAVPVDHWLDGTASLRAYRRAIRTAIRACVGAGTIATIGIPASGAHPGFGYLCAGKPVTGFASPRVFRLARFVEKPSTADEAALLRRPRTYWNSGMFIGTAETFLERVTEHLPNHARRLWGLRRHLGRPGFARAAAAAYRALKPVSFDHGVMDHVRDGLVVEGRFAWSDLGSWEVWARLGGSAVRHVSVDSRGVTIVSRRPHVFATIGLRDTLVVHTEDATLICPMDRSQAVRDVVKQLSRHGQGSRVL